LATGLEIQGAFIPRRVFTQPGPIRVIRMEQASDRPNHPKQFVNEPSVTLAAPR